MLIGLEGRDSSHDWGWQSVLSESHVSRLPDGSIAVLQGTRWSAADKQQQSDSEFEV